MEMISGLPESPVCYVEVESFRFAYREYPNPGQPTLVLLHGLAESSAFFWRPLIAGLHGQYDILAFDLLGHGDSSSQPAYGYAARTQARLLEQALTKLRQPPYIVLGHSLGGVLGVRMALDLPQHISSLVVYDTPLPQGVLKNIGYYTRYIPLNALLPIAPLVLPGAGFVAQYVPLFRQITRLLLLQWRVPYRRERLDKEYLDYTMQASRIGLANSVREIFFKENILSEMARMTIPTLLIMGEGDVLLRPEMLHRVAHINPLMQVQVIPDAGHVSLLDQPEYFLQALLAFLAT